MKVRVAGTDLFRAIFAAFGANPTTMNFGEVFTALQQGTISAQENPLSIIDSSRMHEVQSYLTVWDYAYDPLVLTFNRRSWDALTDDQRELLTECGREAMAYQRQVVREEDERLVRELRERGMEVTVLSPEERRAFRNACAGVYETFRERIGADVVAAVEAAVKASADREPEQ
jgi:TRAP-type C4-dicarboxylate transport system substrate-binding protein